MKNFTRNLKKFKTRVQFFIKLDQIYLAQQERVF